MRILVTGSSGFIGQHTVRALREMGNDVLELDSKKSRMERVDIRHGLSLYRHFSYLKPDYVIHLAAQSSVAVSIKRWQYDAETNIIGTINLIECCQKYNVRKIVFASSGGTVYGQQAKLPYREGDSVNPESPYGISKLSAEHYIRISGLDFAILRYSNVYGPGQNPLAESGVIAIFIGNILSGRDCIIYGDGSSTRDYVFIDDIVKANIMALGDDVRGIYNIGSGRQTTIMEIFKTIAEKLDYNGLPVFKTVRTGEMEHVALCADKAKIDFGWMPEISIEDGISRTIKFMTCQEVCHAV